MPFFHTIMLICHVVTQSQLFANAFFTKEQLAVFFMIPHRKRNVREELRPPSISPQPPPSLLGEEVMKKTRLPLNLPRGMTSKRTAYLIIL